MVWRCSICTVFTTFSLKLLLSHINRLHSRSPDFRILCGIDGCSEDYRVYNSFYHHVKRRHPQYLRDDIQLSVQPEGATAITRPDEDAPSEEEEAFGSLPEQPDSPPPEPDNTDEPQQTLGYDDQLDSRQCGTIPAEQNLRRHATLFVINTRAKSNISQKSVNTIVAGVQQYQSSLLDHLRTQMENVLKKHSGNSSSSTLERDTLNIFDHFVDPFAEVATTFRQDSIIKKQFDSLEAVEIPVAQILCKTKSGDYTVKSKHFHYVPLVESLEQFLSHPKIWSMVEAEAKKCTEGFVSDISDGELFKSHPLFSTKPDALQIILYTDEIEICNPLGSFASKNKLLMVYYTLGNIHPKYRSKLAAIRLLAMAKSADLRQSGVDPLLNRIMEDLNKLHGVEVHTADGQKTLYGAVVSLCGDTLAQHEMAGFKEGVGFAFCKCRHCECSFEDMQVHFREDAFTKRTVERHVKQCDEIEKAQTCCATA